MPAQGNRQKATDLSKQSQKSKSRSTLQSWQAYHINTPILYMIFFSDAENDNFMRKIVTLFLFMFLGSLHYHLTI